MLSISTNLSDAVGMKWKELCGSRSTTSYKLLRDVVEYLCGSTGSTCPCCGGSTSKEATGSTVDLDPPKSVDPLVKPVPVPVPPVVEEATGSTFDLADYRRQRELQERERVEEAVMAQMED